MKNKFIAAVLFALILSISVFAQKKDIVETAIEAGSFKTFAKALTEAGLIETLKGKGPFTVFAPTDDAFAKLPKGALDNLLKDKEALKKVLLYHVVSGKVTAKDVMKLKKASTVEGQDVAISVMDGKVMINKSHVTTADVAASNGVIHIIDAVLMPKEKMKDIVETAIAAGKFKTLAKALTEAGLIETLKGKGPFTVFAPTDDAFAKLPKGTLDNLLKDKEALKKVLLYHVVSGKVMAKDVAKLKKATTVEGQDVAISVMDGKVMINKSHVTTADVATSNGVIHILDTVLMPKEAKKK
ncbi:MAG: beta-Ig-H3/fasciclin [Ignavibacteriae bacterium HGW-Ignavibacteriae-2]|jgi:transforming growth factor-beta-induced protein|nr:MAG: beta-Ig-H3/fasciclin [Ignavibacteriae bacterium HGW-Ignavibacteriae-2]